MADTRAGGPSSTRATGGTSRFWDVYSWTYDAIRFAIPYRMLLDCLAGALALEPGMDVLDLGCGTGNLEHRLGPSGADITGVDFSPSMLERAAKKCAAFPNVTFETADLGSPLPFPDAAFDRVVANNSLYAVADRAALIAEVRRVLRPGGRLVLSDPMAGAKLGLVMRAHFAALAERPPLQRVAGTLWSAVWIPIMATAPLLMISSTVARRRRSGEYHFSTRVEMEELLSRFADVRISTVYGDQNWLVTAYAACPSEKRTASSAMSSDSSLPVNDITSP